LLKKRRDCKVVMTGMEPTCRKDIFELIERAGNRTSLITNGIKLEALEYVQKLKSHGLKKVFISFNGLNDEIYRKMNGKNLLRTKLKALENLELEKIDTLLSVTLAKGVNEDQILPLVKFCFERRSFIFELRIRTLTPIGKHLNAEQICLSELIQLVADSLQVSKTDILREFCFMQAFIENFSWLLPKGFRDKYRSKLCSFIFHIKKESGDRYSSPGSRIDLDRISKSSFKSLYFFYYLVKAYGPLLLVDTALHVLNLPRFVVQNKMLNITLKCWPNLYNVDLTEMNKCPSMYYKNGEMEKFCLSNIKNSAKKEIL
jgi:Molybdenum cofactor biosynthesis enzyme